MPETILTKPLLLLYLALGIITNIGAIGRVPPRQMPDATRPIVVW